MNVPASASSLATGFHALDSRTHHVAPGQPTGEVLRNLLAAVAECPAPDRVSHQLKVELTRRIVLAAEISDILFSSMHRPDLLEDRLRRLCQSVICLNRDADQRLVLGFTMHGNVAAHLEETLLRVAHVLVGNAVRHGMYMRMIGRIAVRVAVESGGTVLEVTDDGWGCSATPAFGEGLRTANLLAMRYHGHVTLRGVGDRTVAMLSLPAT
jgi:two-component sensor histidine kinase